MHIIDFSLPRIKNISILFINVFANPTPPDRELQDEPEIIQSHLLSSYKKLSDIFFLFFSLLYS